MALLFKQLFREVPGARKMILVEITLANPYVVGGHVVAASDLQLTTLIKIIPMATSSPLYVAYWDDTNKKIQISVIGAPGAEAGAIDLSAIKVYALAIGY